MGESRRIKITDESGVIKARLLTREMAKEIGMSIIDQASISLAVSSLAHMIKLGDSYRGEIVLNHIADIRRKGVKVVWLVGPECNSQEMAQDLNNNNLHLMIHELYVQVSPASGICITAVMWTPPPTRFLMEETS